MFKLLFPSWRFFDRPSTQEVFLEFYTSTENKSETEKWTENEAPPRKFWQLLHNPQENCRLFLQSKIEELLEEDIQENSKAMKELEKCAQATLSLYTNKALTVFRFRVCAQTANNNKDILFESMPIEVD